MKLIKFIATLFIMLCCLSSCSFGDIYYAWLQGGMKGIEVYCQQVNDSYICRACEGTNRNKTDDEIKRLYPLELKEMKELLINKNFINCSVIIIIEINDDKINYLSMLDFIEEYKYLNNYFGI